MSVKFVPFYFPQFHAIPENDLWWGEGYTDWKKVKESTSLGRDHYQPRVPINDNYYDQSMDDTLKWQIDTALNYNIHGFNFYHYWFDGKLLLEKPISIFKKLDHKLNYCITWANETWTKRWDGKFNEILIKQNHNADTVEWSNHFDYLYEFFIDERYIKFDGKPVFCIYRPDLINEIDKFIAFFQERAREKGLQGIHFVAVKAYEVSNKDLFSNFDSFLRFQPRDLFNTLNSGGSSLKSWVEKKLRSLPEKYQIMIGELKYKYQKPIAYDYNEFWQKLLIQAKGDEKSEKKVFQSVIRDWDNAPRYGNKARYFKNTGPELFESYMRELIALEEKDLRSADQVIFINAWNEWSEGAYLEPDKKFGYKYLEILKKLSAERIESVNK